MKRQKEAVDADVVCGMVNDDRRKVVGGYNIVGNASELQAE
jgi:hypothetical protein